jgi:2-polyprenyl-6-methoxyphenol hydroxylase-like FAD-dependent oxidoreductase
MTERFDVIVVGARCAGSPLAALLARHGLRVAVVERATFPRDTLSTHIFQAAAINFLARLGVLEAVRSTGAYAYTRIDGRRDDFEYSLHANQRPGDAGAVMSVRRFLLDPILADAAAAAGAEMMFATNVTGVLHERGRVARVRVSHGGAERELQARLVVGADGRNSTVAKLVGARKYNVTPGERFAYWSFFEGADPGPDPAIVFHRWDGRFVIAGPADSGLYQVIVLPDMSFLPVFRANLEGAFMEHARACRPVADVIAGARRVGKVFGILRIECFFRESAGPGWALAGDAGHFKDPAPGQGIADAFRQVEALAPVVAGAITDSAARLDGGIAAWARWRDRDAAEHYWFAADLGAAGRGPAVVPEMMRRLHQRGRLDELADVFQHRATPSAVLTPPQLLAATAALLARSGCDRRAVLREVGELIAVDARRKRLVRKPEFVAIDSHRDAEETEVREEVAP